MVLRALLFITSLLVAGCAAYFSVLGIATLFSGSYVSVLIMASALEIGKLVATTYLHHYWTHTSALLKGYLVTATLILMCITSLGIFGYLSSAYAVNSIQFSNIDSQVGSLQERKSGIDSEVSQINSRIETLNSARRSQEERLPKMSAANARPIYADIERTAAEMQAQRERIVQLQDNKRELDTRIQELKLQMSASKDIGTFKFIADQFNLPLDTIVMAFICIIIAVFDPLAIALLLSYNSTLSKTLMKDKSIDVSNRIYDLSDGL